MELRQIAAEHIVATGNGDGRWTDVYVTPYADAQATIAALQVRVRELCKFRQADHEQLVEVQKYWRESQDEVHELQSQLTQRTAELEAVKRRVDELEAREVDVVLLREDLEQRTAELEAANKLLYKKNCELGRFETIISDLQAELERVRGELAETKLYLQQERANRDSLAACVDRDVQTIKELRTLIAALPKVEGDFDVVARYRNENGSVHLNDEVKALLQHRQGMEG